MTSLEEFEVELLKKGMPLEREYLDFILKNKLLYEYMGNKYSNLIQKYTFEFEWFDFIENNFSLFNDVDKLKKLNNIFNDIIQCYKGINKTEKIIFLYIGLTGHWILVIYDSFYNNTFIEMDSYIGTKDVINLKYLDNQEIDKFIHNFNVEIAQFKGKSLTLQCTENETLNQIYKRYCIKADLNINDVKFYKNGKELKGCEKTLSALGITTFTNIDVTLAKYVIRA
jgi:hypothetical protein